MRATVMASGSARWTTNDVLNATTGPSEREGIDGTRRSWNPGKGRTHETLKTLECRSNWLDGKFGPMMQGALGGRGASFPSAVCCVDRFAASAGGGVDTNGEEGRWGGSQAPCSHPLFGVGTGFSSPGRSMAVVRNRGAYALSDVGPTMQMPRTLTLTLINPPPW